MQGGELARRGFVTNGARPRPVYRENVYIHHTPILWLEKKFTSNIFFKHQFALIIHKIFMKINRINYFITKSPRKYCQNNFYCVCRNLLGRLRTHNSFFLEICFFDFFNIHEKCICFNFKNFYTVFACFFVLTWLIFTKSNNILLFHMILTLCKSKNQVCGGQKKNQKLQIFKNVFQKRFLY